MISAGAPLTKRWALARGSALPEELSFFSSPTGTLLASGSLPLPAPSPGSHGPSPQQEGGNVRTDGLGWDAWKARGLDWRELGLIEGREARRVGVPSPQVHLWGEGCPL